MPSVFGSLNENGYFYDPVERGKLCIILFIIHSLNILLPKALSGKHNHKIPWRCARGSFFCNFIGHAVKATTWLVGFPVTSFVAIDNPSKQP